MTMEFSNFEKRLLLVCIKFLYRAGPHYVSMLWDGDNPPKQESWEECQKRMRKLYKRIKDSIDDGCIPNPKTNRSHFLNRTKV
jgi:hypothetical protein